ncbi:MAG: iron ABC transporter permease [Bacteroidetes bacterium CG12_big_fil_rev_8_21_14_0_65_60_17]|nr:MAG: iron ABC transporter permease [Bacteroidetes bacterium CG12_big_fil_rev_8_21_14_0_65_60_17]
MLLSRRTNWWMGGLVLAILLAYVVWPTISVFSTGLKPSNVSRLLGPAGTATREALFNSVWISLWTVVGAGALGTLLAWLLHRFDFPLRRVVTSVAALPLALPPLVGVLAFLFLYGESGMLPRALQVGLGLENVPFSFGGLWAVWLVHVYSMYVFFYLFCAAALKTLDRSQMEAAEDLGAGAWQSFRSVALPHLRPAMTGSALLVFMISMASFTAPLLFAGTERFLTLQIYNYKMNGDLEMSAAVSVLLTVICLLFLAGLELDRRRKSEATGKGTPAPPRPVTSGWMRAVAVLTAGGVLLFLLLPVLTIVLVSFVKEGSWTYQVLPTAFTLENYTGLFADADVFAPIGNSLRMATLATIANLIFGVSAALFIVKGTTPGRGLVRLLAVLPFAIPGTVIAINLIVTFDSPGPLSAGQALTGTVWLLPLAYFIRHIPLVVRSTTAALESYDDRLTDASMDLGAGTAMTLRRVVLPVIAPGIVAGTLLTFVTALGEFVSSILLYVFDNRPISVEILSQLRIYDFGAAAAYSVFLMILIGLATLVTARAR